MTPDPKPRWLPFPRHRRLVTDLLHFASQIPTQPLARRCNLAPILAARETRIPKIGWAALFMKAYGLVAQRNPVLRQSYMTWPWPHLYEHPTSVCTLTVSREIEGQDGLLFPQILNPEGKSLEQLTEEIHYFATAPVWSVSIYRRMLRYCNLPDYVRKLLWWGAMHRSGPKRVRQFGTFGMTSVGSEGADTPDAYTTMTGCISYGPITKMGDCILTLVYDHRVLDGRLAGRCLAEMERALNEDLRGELLQNRCHAA